MTVPHTQSTITLYTELDAECDQQLAIVAHCSLHQPRWVLSPGAINNKPTTVAVYITLANSQRDWRATTKLF